MFVFFSMSLRVIPHLQLFIGSHEHYAGFRYFSEGTLLIYGTFNRSSFIYLDFRTFGFETNYSKLIPAQIFKGCAFKRNRNYLVSTKHTFFFSAN